MLATAAVLSLSCFTNRQRGMGAQDHTPVIQAASSPEDVTLRNHVQGTGNYLPDMRRNPPGDRAVILTTNAKCDALGLPRIMMRVAFGDVDIRTVVELRGVISVRLDVTEAGSLQFDEARVRDHLNRQSEKFWRPGPGAQGAEGTLPADPGAGGAGPELDGQGRRLAEIVAECGVSAFTVRNALGRVPARGAGEPASAAPEPQAAPEPEALPVLPDPVPRDGERALARFGLLGEGAAPVFAGGAPYPLAGLLLALPALERAGLLASAKAVYGRLRNGFYGLGVMLVFLVFLALLREPRAEGATRTAITAVGRVLGLDRAPEVKTIRRKLGELAARGKAAELQLAIARHHAAARPGVTTLT